MNPCPEVWGRSSSCSRFMGSVLVNPKHATDFRGSTLNIGKPIGVGLVSNICYFHPDPWGNDPIYITHIFQVGWFNHQLGDYGRHFMEVTCQSNFLYGRKKWPQISNYIYLQVWWHTSRRMSKKSCPARWPFLRFFFPPFGTWPRMRSRKHGWRLPGLHC